MKKNINILLLISLLMFSSLSFSQGMYTLSYTMGFGTGEMRDYISKASFRGLSLDGRAYLNDNVSLGGFINWSGFFENPNDKTFNEGTVSLTGNQYRYINAYPILFTTHYYFADKGDMPRVYIGMGAGAYNVEQKISVGIWSSEKSKWHFGISPEIGFLLPVAVNHDVNISLKWNYTVKGKDDESINYSWFGLSFGYALSHYSLRK